MDLTLEGLQPGVHGVLLPLDSFHRSLLLDLLVVDRGEALQGFLELSGDPRLDAVHALPDLNSEGGYTPPNFAANHLTDGSCRWCPGSACCSKGPVGSPIWVR